MDQWFLVLLPYVDIYGLLLDYDSVISFTEGDFIKLCEIIKNDVKYEANKIVVNLSY